jgi:hypothetical protein
MVAYKFTACPVEVSRPGWAYGLPWVDAAVVEQVEQCVAPPKVMVEIGRQLRSYRRFAFPLHPAARLTLEAAFACDFRAVRIHCGPAATELAEQVGAAAFCCGSDIVLGYSALAAPPSLRFAILQHELAHAAFGHRDNCIYCWKASGHEEITRDIAQQYVGQGLLLDQLAGASAMMDYRLSRLLKLVPKVLPIFAPLTAKVQGWPMGPPGRWRPPPEGPQHGEAGMYRENWEKAWADNEKAQSLVVDRAATLYKEWEAKIRARLKPGEPFYLKESYLVLSITERTSPSDVLDWVECLGHALHIAQDRGSHGEGAAGMGHRDPRLNWDCDNPNMNLGGWIRARHYSNRVMEDFVRLANFPVNPFGVWHCGARDCPTHSAATHRCATGVWFCGCRSPVCPGHSSPNHRCSKERGRAWDCAAEACPANHPHLDDDCKNDVWYCGRLQPACPGHRSRRDRCVAGAVLLNRFLMRARAGPGQAVDLETPV